MGEAWSGAALTRERRNVAKPNSTHQARLIWRQSTSYFSRGARLSLRLTHAYSPSYDRAVPVQNIYIYPHPRLQNTASNDDHRSY